MSTPPVEILFEDNHLLVINKPAGMLSQADSSGAPDLLTELKGYIKVKYNKPGNVFLGLVHRLDRNTSGLMVVARTSKAASRLSEQFRLHSVEKIYRALVSPPPAKPEGTLESRLTKDNQNLRQTEDEEGGEARLTYRTLRANSKEALLEIELETGRFHQIRFQLSNAGSPVAGDRKYGSKLSGPLALCCVRLSFNHPVTKERLTFETKAAFETRL